MLPQEELAIGPGHRSHGQSRGKRLRSVFQSLPNAAQRMAFWRPRRAMTESCEPRREEARSRDARRPAARSRPLAPSALHARPDHHGALAVLGPRHLRHPDRAHPHRADASRGRGRSAHQSRARARHAGDHRLAGRRPLARATEAGCRRAAPCPCRQSVQRDRRRPRHPARGLRQRVARSRPRSLVLGPHQIDHPELDRCRHGLSPGARSGHPHRHARHGQGHRRGGRSGALSAAGFRHVPERPGLDQSSAHGLSHRRRRQGARHCGVDAGISLSPAAEGGDGPRQEGTGDRDRAGPDQPRRRDQESRQFQRHLSLCDPAGERARAATAARDARQCRRVSAARAAPRRRAGGLRAHVCGDCAHPAALGHLDRHVVRQSSRRPDPPADGGGAGDLRRQSRRRGRRQSGRRRSRRARLDLQHHGVGAQDPARRAGRRQHQARRAQALHGGGAVRRDGRRRRRRCRQHDQVDQPLGRDSARRQGGESDRQEAGRGGARVRRRF